MAANRTRRTPKKRARDWKPDWLQAFAETGMVSAACQRAGVGRTTAYDARAVDEAFATAWDELVDETTDRMEREAQRRAVEGIDHGVWYQGDLVGHERLYSDTLLIFLMKARRPETYRENVRHEHTGPTGGPVQVEGVDLSGLSVEKLRALRALLEEARDGSAEG